MKLGLSIARYRRRLLRPLATARGALTERLGAILTLEDSEGRVGQGEVAPIEWIDGESLDTAVTGLERLGRELVLPRAAFDGSVERRVAWLTATARDLAPSARAALDAASLDLASRQLGLAVARHLDAGAATRVHVNALVVEASPAAVVDAARARLARGYRVIKLKVGAGEPSLDIERVRAARGALGVDARLRLDANGAWSLDVAQQVLAQLGTLGLDYVEEPLADPTRPALLELARATSVPLAVDESFERLGGADALVRDRCCDVVVLKPARVGGLTRAVALGRRLVACGLRVVLTDAIETGVGCRAVVHAAAALASSGVAEAIGLGGPELMQPDEHEAEADWIAATDLVASGPGLAVTCARETARR